MLDPKVSRIWKAAAALGFLIWADPASSSEITSPQTLPPLPGTPRFEHGAIWDPETGKAYVFSGMGRDSNGNYLLLNELWSFDPQTRHWIDLSSAKGPGPRTGAAVAWDPIRGQVFVSGGLTYETSCSDELWSYSVGADKWQEHSGEPTRGYIARRYHSLTYDSIRDRFWQMSGFCSDEPYRSYSEYDIASDIWSPLQVIGGAYGYRIKHAAIWDPNRARLLVLGGELPAYAPGQGQILYWQIVWSVEPEQNLWTPLPHLGGLPNRRSSFISGYDPYLDALVVYGGLEFEEVADPSPVVSGALWAYLLGSSEWVRLDDGELPKRMRAAGVYSSATGQILAFGGLSTLGEYGSPGDIRAETFAVPVELPATFKWMPGGRGVDPASSRSGILDAPLTSPKIMNVRLMDAGTGKSLQGASDTRRMGNSKWRITFGPASDEELAVSAAGNLVIAGLMEGHRRAFLAHAPEDKQGAPRDIQNKMLNGTAGAGTSSFGELALEGFRPNPAGDMAAISFSLPDAGPATLEVHDVRGRVVFKEDVGGLGPGTHLVRLEGSSKLLPGMYWIRLVRVETTLTAKGIVVR